MKRIALSLAALALFVGCDGRDATRETTDTTVVGRTTQDTAIVKRTTTTDTVVKRGDANR